MFVTKKDTDDQSLERDWSSWTCPEDNAGCSCTMQNLYYANSICQGDALEYPKGPLYHFDKYEENSDGEIWCYYHEKHGEARRFRHCRADHCIVFTNELFGYGSYQFQCTN